MISVSRAGFGIALGFSLTSLLQAAAPAAHAPAVPTDLKGKEGVKAYLLTVIEQTNIASADLKKAANEYQALIDANGKTPSAAAAAKPQETADLILRLRDAYQRIDSFGYEYVEGIVAGVPSLSKYDVELDAGVPAKGAGLQDNVAPVKIVAGDVTIDREGSLNNFLIEPTVFGTNPRFIDGTAKLPGFDKPVGLPKPALISALADYAVDAYGRLKKDSEAWKPTDSDLFHVLASMTPTLADYFDDWKETKKYGQAEGGRFVAVSRLSDMRGIMSSTRLAWLALADSVKAKDAALADKISHGYDLVISFIDTVEAREARKPLNVEMIDALGTQAKERADKLAVQVAQAAAVMGIDVNSK
jgi:hypothetical protein